MGNRYADHVTPLYPQKLALTSPTGGGRSVGIVRSQTKATEFSLYIKIVLWRVAKRLSYIEDARCLKVNEAVAIFRLLSSGTLVVVSDKMKTDAGIFSETLAAATLRTASRARGL